MAEEVPNAAKELPKNFTGDMDASSMGPLLTKAPKPVFVHGQPISHKADGSDQEQLERLIDREIEQEVESNSNEPPPEPVKVSKVKAVKSVPAPKPEPEPETPVHETDKEPDEPRRITGKGAISAFKQAVGSALIPVQLYSEDKEVFLRELTVTDQKSLSKTALINNSRRDVIFSSQCAMINNCVKGEGKFRIQDYTEFDRIVILLRLYEQNYFKNEVRYTCSKCGKENVYQLDFSKILARIKKSWRPDQQYIVEHAGKEFHLTVGWPKVSTITEFYNTYYKAYQNSNENTRNTIDQLSNVEYLVMFIKGIDLVMPNGDTISLDLNNYTYSDRTDVIDSLPQGIIFDDENGIINKVVSDFTDPLNKAFQYEKCQFCGAETEEGIGSVADFI